MVFYCLLDVAVVNAYILESKSPNHLPTHSTGKKKKHEFITQKAFVLELIEELLSYFSQEDGQA